MRGNFPPENNDNCLPWLLSPYFFYGRADPGLPNNTVQIIYNSIQHSVSGDDLLQPPDAEFTFSISDVFII